MALTLHDPVLGVTISAYSGQCGGCVFWERDLRNVGMCLVGRGETLDTDYHLGTCYMDASEVQENKTA